VAVGHLETGQHHPDPRGLECRHLRTPDCLRDIREVGEEGRFQIEPVVDLEPWDDQRVAWSERSDGEEGDAFIVFPDEARGQLPFDDLSEDRGHASRLACNP